MELNTIPVLYAIVVLNTNFMVGYLIQSYEAPGVGVGRGS